LGLSEWRQDAVHMIAGWKTAQKANFCGNRKIFINREIVRGNRDLKFLTPEEEVVGYPT
jgi:hypothetical protein